MWRMDGAGALWKSIGIACGGGAWISSISEAAIKLLGVPLPVVLGAAAGAFLARAYLPSARADGTPIGYFRALAVSAAWTVGGSAGAPMVHSLVPALLGAVMPGTTLALPAGALAGIAGLIAAAPAWAPKIWPLIAARFGGGKGGAQ